jgi:hypothetical protein
MQVTIIADDGIVIVNGRALPVDLSALAGIHAVQWTGSSGWIEFKADGNGNRDLNQTIDNFAVLQPYVDAWTNQLNNLPPPPTPPKPTQMTRRERTFVEHDAGSQFLLRISVGIRASRLRRGWLRRGQRRSCRHDLSFSWYGLQRAACRPIPKIVCTGLVALGKR